MLINIKIYQHFLRLYGWLGITDPIGRLLYCFGAKIKLINVKDKVKYNSIVLTSLAVVLRIRKELTLIQKETTYKSLLRMKKIIIFSYLLSKW